MGKGLFEVLFLYYPIFFKGLLGTLKFSAIALLFGSIVGTLVGIIGLSKNKIINGIYIIYTTYFRGIPLLVHMYLCYYFLPMALPMFDNVSKTTWVIVSLVLNSSAYVSEIIRGGITSVDKGQTEAARSLGMSASHCMTKIVLPQAIRNILPALGNEYIAMTKETSLAGTFMLYELMFTRTLLMNKYLVWQPLFIIAFIYLILTEVLTFLVKIIEKRLAISDK